ncbi:MAG: phosphate ABC transporter permease subunit PstC [Actinomycetes bacterium]
MRVPFRSAAEPMQSIDPTIALEGVHAAPDVPVRPVTRRNAADRIFRITVTSAGALTLALMALIGLFLLIRSWDAVNVAGWSFLTTARWEPDGGVFGIAAVLFGTFLIAVVALAVAVPVSIIGSIFITDYAPARLRTPLIWLVDLLAAVPSLIYGLWGRAYLQPKIIPLSDWISTHLGFIPFLQGDRAVGFAASTFIAGLVVALMVLPICTAVMREVFAQAPAGEKEGALALGGTRWGVIRTVVLPFGQGGMVGASMLGLGRALGETIAITLIISPTFEIDRLSKILQTGGNSIASLIALRFSESSSFGISALMAAGLTLFVITLLVNAVASIVVARSRSGASTEI